MSALAEQFPLTRSKVAIIGFTDHSAKAPWLDDSWVIWSLNDLHSRVEEFAPGIFQTDRVEWWQLHRPESGEHFHGARDPQHFEWMTKQTCPIWMFDAHPQIPGSKVIPIEAILREFLPHAYFNNSISWMIAFAILRGAKEIGLWGVDMAVDGIPGEGEHAFQRPSVEYFLGIIEGLYLARERRWGMDTPPYLPMESELLKCGYLYGWDNCSALRRKLNARLDTHVINEEHITAQYEAIKRELFHAEGQIAAFKSLGEAGAKQVEELTPRVQQLANELEYTKRSLHHCRGEKDGLVWMLRNYLPGDGATQDLHRTERSVTAEKMSLQAAVPLESLPPSDGHPKRRPRNRVAAALKE